MWSRLQDQGRGARDEPRGTSGGASLARAKKGQAPAVIAVADKAAQRLHRKFEKLQTRDKPVAKAVVAVARELAGFIWAALYPMSVQAA